MASAQEFTLGCTGTWTDTGWYGEDTRGFNMEVKVAVVRVLCDRKNMLCGVDGLVLRFGNGMEGKVEGR